MYHTRQKLGMKLNIKKCKGEPRRVDEALLELDQELDARLLKLLKIVEPPSSKGHGLGVHAVIDQQVDGRPNPKKVEFHSEDISRQEKNVNKETHASSQGSAKEHCAENGKDVSSVECTETASQADSDQQSIKNEKFDYDTFDDFLDQSTKLRIRSLMLRCKGLSEDLAKSQEDCRKLQREKKDVCENLHASEQERKKVCTQLKAVQTALSRQEKQTQNLQEEVKKLNQECKEIRKERDASHSAEGASKSLATSLEARLSRALIDNTKLRQQLKEETRKKKENHEVLKSTNEKQLHQIRGLERTNRDLMQLVGKQHKLIDNLKEQKNQIAAAKAAQCLQEQFLSIISPIQEQLPS
ncbi:uncharacterized protein LOC143033414 isoform X2 [Oratosquilla oratoria]|uniref:uncharacterized protein LOC143033414 isoform X2 n=1 Tax=Oratosquilla oratoria TaxID=337810 RepID=UPI003F769972